MSGFLFPPLTEQLTFNCIYIPALFHTTPNITAASFLTLYEPICSVSIWISVLSYQLPSHMRFHITIIFGFAVAKILLQSWKRIVIVMARRQIAAVRSTLKYSFSHKIIPYIDLFKTIFILHRAFWRFTEYCTPINALIVYHILV
jgi:hypothetical protein